MPKILLQEWQKLKAKLPKNSLPFEASLNLGFGRFLNMGKNALALGNKVAN